MFFSVSKYLCLTLLLYDTLNIKLKIKKTKNDIKFNSLFIDTFASI